MKHISLENYRCFGSKQTARLAPITLLIGDQSTGKTSFLAIIRAFWDCVYGRQTPNFQEEPFDLGSYDGIIHRPKIGHHQKQQTPAVKSGHHPKSSFIMSGRIDENIEVEITFGKNGTVPVPLNTLLKNGHVWIRDNYDIGGRPKIQVGTSRGIWEAPLPEDVVSGDFPLIGMRRLLKVYLPEMFYDDRQHPNNFAPLNGSSVLSQSDSLEIIESELLSFDLDQQRPYASAPVRSKPSRTYDPASLSPDPEGDYVPMLLANLANHHLDTWKSLKKKIEDFGSQSGIFDEINIKRLGKLESDPFQIQVRKFQKKRKGPKRNLRDVGYGISQVLPILTELLLPENTRMLLVQQPEVHLHLGVQAELGSLFCNVAAQGRQLIIETHSDYLMDRIRMDVRDEKTDLKPEDVSILFFEHASSEVHIHSIEIDEMGNYLNTPAGYRDFFMNEVNRSLGLV
ncbi:MAG: AAA family ATPase [Bacteroidetes bacterium]|nr:AAA family ATPase [Bacteroidota bacterium]